MTAGAEPSQPVPLPELLRARAAESPDAVFLQDVSGGAATYAQTLARVDAWTRALNALGVKAGDRVGTFVANSVESVICWIAIASLRAIETPIHPLFTGYMLEHAVNSVGAEVIITEPTRLADLVDSAQQLKPVRAVVVVGEAELPSAAWPTADFFDASSLLATSTEAVSADLVGAWDTAAIIYTSGTTGPSKGVVVPWGVLAASARRTFPFGDLASDDVFYVFTPASHIGAKILPYLAAILGGRAVMRADFKIDEFISDIKRFGITTAPVVGAIPHFLAQMPETPEDVDIPLRNLVMAPLIPDLEAFKQRFGVRICTAYNMTEMSIPFASEGWDVDNYRAVGKVLGGSPGVEVRLVDEHDLEVPTGEVGELIARTSEPWTMNGGYFGMPEATAEAWRNGWFHTGDAFKCDADGYYYFVDRIKDAIRRRGENISSFEVETMVNMHPSVAESAAVAVKADTTEEEVKVFVVAKPGATIDFDELAGFMAEKMPRFMVPRYIEMIDALPKTTGTMRTKKNELRALGQSANTWDRLAASTPRSST